MGVVHNIARCAVAEWEDRLSARVRCKRSRREVLYRAESVFAVGWSRVGWCIGIEADSFLLVHLDVFGFEQYTNRDVEGWGSKK